MNVSRILFYTFLVFFNCLNAQDYSKNNAFHFSKQDSLRGSITPERAWWDVIHCQLDVKVDLEHHSISGTNTIRYKVLGAANRLQLDLQQPMTINKVTHNGQDIPFTREEAVFYILFGNIQKLGSIQEIVVHFEGTPLEAKNAPWEGGFTWSKDSLGLDFVASACQGLGASAWWPIKDHVSDKVDSMHININVPNGLMGVSNGRLQAVVNETNGTRTYKWFVSNPIANYNVAFNMGNYERFFETYNGENGTLDCEYYVLKEALTKAKIHFNEVPKMLKAFEYWMGPYPFYEDSYKLIQAPYLGMEHQSGIAYGNGFQKGYLGTDLSGTGWGLQFDFCIIHESGHEWFGNNITCKDLADMWIHEGFTTYAESLFVEYYYGKSAASNYLIGLRKGIENVKPIIGPYLVNQQGPIDMYRKGANIVHTLRQIVNNDVKWRSIFREINRLFYHQTVETATIENYFSKAMGMNLKPFFDQYLRAVNIPTFEYKYKNNKLFFRWNHCISSFSMPLKVTINNKIIWLKPQTKWSSLRVKSAAFKPIVAPDFYINSNALSQ